MDLEKITQANIPLFAELRLRTFSKDEEDPEEVALNEEISLHREELKGTGRGLQRAY